MEVEYVEVFQYYSIRNYSSYQFTNFINRVRNDANYSTKEIFTLLILIYCTAGCVGNMLICYVIISFKHMLTTVNLYLFSLAVSDCLMLLTFTFGILYCMHFSSMPFTTSDFTFFWTSVLHTIGSLASRSMTLMITIDRYIAICHPFKGQKIFNRPRTVRIILLLWIFSGIHGVIFVLCSGQDGWGRVIVSVEFVAVVHFFIPMLVIIALYTMIVCKIRRSSRLRGSHRGPSTRRKHAFRKKLSISVAVVVEFFICFGPISVAVLLMKYNLISWVKAEKSFIYLLGVLLYLLSTVVNPIIYLALSSKFRSAIKELICCSKSRYIQSPLSQFNGL